MTVVARTQACQILPQSRTLLKEQSIDAGPTKGAAHMCLAYLSVEDTKIHIHLKVKLNEVSNLRVTANFLTCFVRY